MSIDVPPAEVHALAGTVRAAAADAAEIAPRLDRPGAVGDVLQPAVEAFLDAHRAAGRALAGELGWLGGTVAAVADSWQALDRGLLASRGRPGGR
ncbi:hypothetical protein [Blastococcus tunisiensis]|uniref:Excreted virulence factor EspC, type VII ESX diderm n=1 Tax=Blastococcus tunisiensis TaxID=1798228 RepID=A0A1I1W265_9ACTN|nr:hypothetical protein [Blastococcus sp. DSM 46838]SFD88468.1 hypothetical protein SAMN05216574_101183 [Blastococcus sp. DSM 46838]